MSKQKKQTEKGVRFTGSCWVIPDGRTFNTRNKAEKYLKDIFYKKAKDNDFNSPSLNENQ